MKSQDLNKNVRFVSTGIKVGYINKIRKFYKYYQTHSYDDTILKFGFTDKVARTWISRIEQDKFNNLLIEQQNRTFSLTQKLEIITFARKWGYTAARDKYRVSRVLIAKWVNQYKQHCLEWNPNFNLLKKPIPKDKKQCLLLNLKKEDDLMGVYLNEAVEGLHLIQ